MSASVFSQRTRESDGPLADEYQAIADHMRIDARFYDALAEDVTERPELLTFDKAYAEGLRRRYADLAAFCREAAGQAQTIADDYRSHADGTHVPLRPM